MKATTTNNKDTTLKQRRTTTIYIISSGKDYRFLNQHLSIDDLDYVKDKPKHKRNRIDTTSVRVNDTNDSTDTNDINE